MPGHTSLGSSRANHSAGFHPPGYSQGNDLRSGALAQYLPTLYGSFPIWHHASTTPNADGAISAIADVSLGLYPLAQGTPGNQPTRGSGKITFAANDYVSTALDAAIGYPNARAAWTIALVAELNSGVPAANEHFACFGSSTTDSNFVSVAHRTDDKEATFRDTSGVTITSASTANMDGTRAAYIAQGTGGATEDVTTYRENTIITGPTAAALSSTSTINKFSLGALARNTIAGYFNGSIVAAAIMNRVMTSTERSQWQAWKDAGCPL